MRPLFDNEGDVADALCNRARYYKTSKWSQLYGNEKFVIYCTRFSVSLIDYTHYLDVTCPPILVPVSELVEI